MAQAAKDGREPSKERRNVPRAAKNTAPESVRQAKRGGDGRSRQDLETEPVPSNSRDRDR